MARRHLILIDITGRQSEDMTTIVKTIRALHNIAYGYNHMEQVSIDENALEDLRDNETIIEIEDRD